MKVKEVPQDTDPTYQGGHRLCYAVDDAGRIVEAHSAGWDVEQTVKGLAWKVIDADLHETRARVRQGLASPLEYFMKRRLMTPELLAQNMGLWRWRVRRHLRARVFARLNDAWIARYADCLDVAPIVLKEYRGQDESGAAK